jgi:hypothetical protein
MRELPKSFKRDGFTHRQINREGDIAIYRRTKQIGDEQIEHFEVIVVQPYKEFILRGKKHEAGESYSSSELWGTYGLTCHDLDAAWLRFKRIRAEREKRATAAVSLNKSEQTELSL